MKNTIKKINGFVLKLVTLLEHEVDHLHATASKNKVATQKNIADILNKLVKLISEVNKLAKEYNISDKANLGAVDQEILNNFIKKIKSDNANRSKINKRNNS